MARATEAAAVPPRFTQGDRVRVADRYPVRGHIRTPYYLRGKAGFVIRYFGLFFDPTQLAEGFSDGTVCGLYQVAFDYDDVWETSLPAIGSHMTITADLYDNWLEAS